jgi:ribosomal protein S18 acetylase RimI-like enzyme
MQHPLRQARPADPFLRLRLEDRHCGPYAVDGDHVALLRTGRMSGETWVTALGDDPARILALIDELRPHGFHGVTVHDHVFERLPDDLRGPDPGHWSLWELISCDCAPADSGNVVRLAPDDPRIDALLEHSSSAYIRAGDPAVAEWRGIVDGDALRAVGARVTAAHGSAHLVSICTDPRSRGRGLGRAITASLAHSALHSGASRVWLEMYADNAVAARTYSAVGFGEVGRYRSALLREPSSPESPRSPA